MIELSDHDMIAILSGDALKTPCRSGIKAGGRFLLRAKVGGEMQPRTVVCKCAPYRKSLKNGGTAWYVDVFSYGVRRSVNVKKLRIIPA
jgi:hypothetical protein